MFKGTQFNEKRAKHYFFFASTNDFSVIMSKFLSEQSTQDAPLPYNTRRQL